MNNIEILDFDTQLFGFKTGKFAGSTLTSEKAKEVLSECKAEKVKCLYATFSANDYEALSAAVEHNFIISSIRITLDKDLSNFGNDKVSAVKEFVVEEVVEPEDVQYLVELSREVSKGSRFAFDKKLGLENAGNLYEKWIRNSIQKTTADEVFFAREMETQEPVGFIACKNEKDCGHIVLLGVDVKYRRKGIASIILNRAFSYFKENGLDKVEVVTQGSNIPALRLYQRSGFYNSDVSIVFHLWT